MSRLDLPTLIFAFVLFSAFQTLVALGLVFTSRAQRDAYLFTAGTMSSACLAFLCAIAGPLVGSAIPTLLSKDCFMLCGMFTAATTYAVEHRRPPWRLLLGIFGLGVVALQALSVAYGILSIAGVVVVLLCGGGLLSVSLRPLVSARRSGTSVSRVTTALGLTSAIVASVFRLVMVVFRGASTDAGQSGPAGLVFFLLTGLATFSVLTSVIMMVNDGLRKELIDIAQIDLVTGLLNRRALLERATHLAATASRDGVSLTVVVADLDHFKKINDTFGHAAGDRVLGEAARRLQAAAPRDAVVGRYGGEEFCVIARGLGDEAGAALGQAVVQAVREHEGTDLVPAFRLSAGVCVDAAPAEVAAGAEGPDERLARALASADEALYRAKRDGRDRAEAAISSGRRSA